MVDGQGTVVTAFSTDGLVADCGGLIQRIALSLPEMLFDDAAAGGWFRALVPIGNLLAALPADVEVLLLVDDAFLPKARAWVDSLQAECRIVFVPAREGSGRVGGPWIQDAFLVRTAEKSGPESLEILVHEATANPAAPLAAFLQARICLLPVIPPGGNQLVGPDFRLIGRSEMKSRYRGPSVPAISAAETIRAVSELDERRVHVFGYRTEDLSWARGPSTDPETMRGGVAPDEKEPAGFTETGDTFASHQFGFHVDQFVSPTGLRRNGRPLLLVGEPCAAQEPDTALIQNARRGLDASVLALIRQGFEVQRNPVPYALAPDSGKRLPRLYNNIILENEVRPGHERPVVFLPQFGDVEPSLQVFDRLNIEIWEKLGFEAVPVFGWSYFASRNGAIRCISKILQRSKIVV